jgi:hypothetical protein
MRGKINGNVMVEGKKKIEETEDRKSREKWKKR